MNIEVGKNYKISKKKGDLIGVFLCVYKDNQSNLFESIFKNDDTSLTVLNMNMENYTIEDGLDFLNNLLHEAVVANDLYLAKFWLSYNVDINYSEPDFGKTLLMCAVVNNHISMVELLLSNNVDIFIEAYDGSTALDYAQSYSCHEIEDMLIQQSKK